MLRQLSRHTPLPGQQELVFGPRTIEGKTADLLGPEKQLAESILKNREWLFDVLDDIGLHNVQGRLPSKSLEWNKGDVAKWIQEGRYVQIAESFEQLGVSAKESYQPGTGKFIALVVVHREYMRYLMQDGDPSQTLTSHSPASNERTPHSEEGAIKMKDPLHASHAIDAFMQKIYIRVTVNGRDGANEEAIKILLEMYHMLPEVVISAIQALKGSDFPEDRKNEAVAIIRQMTNAHETVEMW